MQFSAPTTRITDKWLFAVTVVFVVALLVLFTSSELQKPKQYFWPVVQVLNNQQYDDTLDAVLSAPESAWQEETNPLNAGLSGEPVWIRFILPVTQIDQQTTYIDIGYPLLDSIDVWVQYGNKTEHSYSGDALPFNQREHKYHGFLFPLEDYPGAVNVVMRVQSSSVVKVPVKIWQQQAFWEYVSNTNLVLGLFFGLLLAMALSNLFFFFTTRTLTFIFYTGYVICLGLTLATLHGFAYKYLWPEQPWFQSKAISLFASTTLIFAVVFSASLLEISNYSKRLATTFSGLAGAFGVIAASALFLDYAVSIRIFLVLLTITVFLIMGVALWLARKKVSVAGYYALAWGALLVSAFTASLDNLDIVNISIPSQYLLVYGATIEVLMLAFILAISYSRQRDFMLSAKEDALEKEREAVRAKQALIDLQQSTQDELEYKVGERTLELEIALRELSEANRELEKLNTIDPLTGIRNRRHFDKRLQAEGRRSRREQTPLALAMVDIDHFKSVNDQYGHSAGDACIQHVATILQQQLKRLSDDVCRYGGEEFGLILPNTDTAGAQQLLEAMRAEIEANPCQVDGTSISLTISAGVASGIIAFGNEETSLLKTADERLYQAKQTGRNRVVAKQ
ncbi:MULTISPECIES: GGDEF domain-containing protein [Marisediminitalea]|uniref:sensor domain-containing diguanylate cyclase n=1 Tax=Marisediminitalea TaxID=2662254 RepID=UPI0020CE1C8B|nr:GGDEF domain-containing protein [Marisediminitalea aggregata]MCP4234100.1 diguanylate cyclase [Aestuariibacter sp.]MCP4529471.1 diguanylate cyclase [Aestuariibacter sp.]MCP4946613.1 diguanylate cyclase [Aestuariibacter sp.]MCP9476980.1 diguanylate cyclase [Marisediminitalea aggregata]